MDQDGRKPEKKTDSGEIHRPSGEVNAYVLFFYKDARFTDSNRVPVIDYKNRTDQLQIPRIANRSLLISSLLADKKRNVNNIS